MTDTTDLQALLERAIALEGKAADVVVPPGAEVVDVPDDVFDFRSDEELDIVADLTGRLDAIEAALATAPAGGTDEAAAWEAEMEASEKGFDFDEEFADLADEPDEPFATKVVTWAADAEPVEDLAGLLVRRAALTAD